MALLSFSATKITNILKMEQPGYGFLFKKKLFASDTGKLCRLIIPKPFAEVMLKFYTDHEIKQVKDPHNVEGLSVRIYDSQHGIEETFAFKYWQSMESYVFKNGWIKFVRRRALKPHDTVKFWMDHANGRLCITCSLACCGTMVCTCLRLGM